MPPIREPGRLTATEQVNAVKTWRALRLTMVLLVAGLAASIGFERWKVDPGCFQTSISAYYYTPVHGVLVGALLAIGVCLVCLRGNTDHEDILLNLAGMFAPVVALVPTPHTGGCASVLGTTQDRNANIANNVFALLVLGLVALVVLAALAARGSDRPDVAARVGYAAAAAVWLSAALVFELARGFFVRNAHYTAAVLMFVCFLLVVVLNATAFGAKTGTASTRNRYAAIAAAMGLAVVVVAVAGALGWRHWVLALEAALITLFAAFWVVQTRELWAEGLR